MSKDPVKRSEVLVLCLHLSHEMLPKFGCWISSFWKQAPIYISVAVLVEYEKSVNYKCYINAKGLTTSVLTSADFYRLLLHQAYE